ncbi:MAG: helix-turn-helix transcriptional regulator [Parachlamydiaceae bacterium]|nr:helix-turn-helix transcriptional regulator [Parachlamydiaceae bacterium]
MSVDRFIEECFGDLPRWAVTLQGLRNREGLTQKKLGEIIGVEQTNISKMEWGKRHIGKQLAMRIAKVFDIDYRLFL